MIVPSARLVAITAAVLFPAAALGALAPGTAGTLAVVAGLLAAAAAVDAWLAPRALDALRLELPPLLRMTKDREAQLEVRLANERAGARTVRVGVPLPENVTSPADEVLTRLPEAQPLSKVLLSLTASRRGSYRLTRGHLEGSSQLGLWLARSSAPVDTELRVYPNLLSERKSVAALFLNQGATGIHAQRQVGRGRDFEKLREYVPGDDYGEIHWKATARRGRPVTKVFQIERTQEVYVVLDASRLSGRTEDGVSALERFVNAALLLALAAERQGDLFGLVTFSDQVHGFVRAKGGKPHFQTCRDALYRLHPRVVTPSFEELFTFLRTRLRRRALLLVLTALDDPALAESFEKASSLVARQHLVFVNALPPRGVRPLFTGEPAATVDEVYDALGGHLQWQGLKELSKRLHRRGVTLSLLQHESFAAKLVTEYVSIKRRQIL